MPIALKRIYQTPSRDDGYRVLVERLWPRGLTRAQARVDLWLKEVAPSAGLRRWFAHDPAKWTEFKRRYHDELRHAAGPLQPLLERARTGRVTFVYAAREERFNNAVALKEFLESLP